MLLNKEVYGYLLGMFEAGAVHKTYHDLHWIMPNQDIDGIFQLAFKPDGYHMYYPAEDMDDDDRPIEEIAPGKFAYFNRRWHEVTEQDMKRYRYRMDWLPKTLKTSLHLVGETQEVLREKLWLLGEIRHNDARTPIWLSRCLSRGRYFDEVYDALSTWNQRREGIILSYSQPEFKRIQLPGNYRIMSPESLLNAEGYISREILVVAADPDQSYRDALLHWDRDRGALHVKGDLIRFSGEKQRKVVDLLFERCFQTQNKWSMQALLEEIGSNSTHINKLFHGHPRWKEVIRYAEGMCWLVVPKL